LSILKFADAPFHQRSPWAIDQLSSQCSQDELKLIFQAMDTDGDGRVNIMAFTGEPREIGYSRARACVCVCV
jgi:Ca2+-binding EF-hand superfamily protein